MIAAIYGQITGKMYDSASDNAIPMWGESGPLVIEPAGVNQSLQLTRAIARIDVGVGVATKTGTTWSWSGKNAADSTIPFQLKHVYVMRPNNSYAVIPDPSQAAGDPTIPAGTTAFSATDSETNFGYAASVSANGGSTSQDIYVPETDIKMGASGTSGDANHTNRMAIVVGGCYNGSATETFYRLDFAVSKNLINVLRNHLYQFNISSVSGDGFPDVITAYNSLAMNMTVDIFDWNQTTLDEIFMDGPLYVMLQRDQNELRDDRTAVVYRDSATTDVIKFQTNIPLSQFSMTLDNGGYFPNPADTTVIQNNRFSVAIKTDTSGNTYFEFTALQPYDAAATDNPSTLTVTTGRISFPITILQRDADPGDWNQGYGTTTDLTGN